MKILVAIVAVLLGMQAVPMVGQMAHAQPEWYLPVGDGCSLFVQEFGQGPRTVVVLHGGWGAEHSYMFTPLQGLGESYHFVFYDQRGSLLSPCAAETISVQKHVQDLERLRVALGVNRIDIVAHSMGTFLAMEYQQAHPEHVREMVMMGTMPPRSAPKTDADKKIGEGQQKIVTEFMGRPEVAAEIHKEGLDGDEKSLTPKQATNKWHIEFAGANVYHVDRWAQVLGGKAYFSNVAGQAAAKTMPAVWDFTVSLAGQSCPTWVIDGDHDYVDPSGRIFAGAMVGDDRIHVVSVPDAGHISWVDDPAGVAKALGEALESGAHCAS